MSTTVGGVISEADRLVDEALRARLGDDAAATVAHADVTLGPTAWAFVQDREGDVLVLEGPRREGKTSSALVRILRVAHDYPAAQPVRVACVRDTWTNLARTVLDTIRQGAARGWWDARMSEQDTQVSLNNGEAHLYLFGMDRSADANKFQSFECGILWLEEAAPAADLASGIPVEVFALGISSLSQSGLPCHAILTMNPPDDSHWTVELLDELERLGRSDLKVRRYWVPPGENRHVPAGYRTRLRAVLEAAGRPDLVQRLVDGQRGSIRLGVAVTPDFVAAQHVAGEPLPLNPRWPTWRSWDFGSTPACVLAQQTPSGHLYVVGALETPEGTAMGIEQFVTQCVLPWQARFGIVTRTRTPHERAFRVRDVGDPAGRSREASNSERSAARSLEALLGTTFESAPPDWPARRDSMAWALRQMIGARRLVQIDPDECKPLVKSLGGAWHYHRTPAGVVYAKPTKDHASHIGDAYGYLCAQLYPVADTLRRLARGTDVAPPPRRRERAHSWYGR